MLGNQLLNSVPGFEEDLNRLKGWISCTPLVKPVIGGRWTTRALVSLIPKFTFVKNSKCHVCIESKQTRKPHKVAEARSLAPLELIHSDLCEMNGVLCWRKNQHTGIRGQVFAEPQKVNQACQSIWPKIDKGENKIKFESVSAGIPNISHRRISRLCR